MPDQNTPIGQQVVQNGGFPRTAQEVFNTPVSTGLPDVSIFDKAERASQGDKKTSLSNLSPVIPSQVDVSGRYPKQILGADNEDLYAKGQSTGEKWWNANKKMLGIASATLAENTVGLLDGLGEWITTGEVSKLWDNSVNKGLNEWTQGLENSSPNYYSKEERDSKFFSSDHLLTANFWADKVMKNLGFSAGAIGGGLVWGSLLKGVGITAGLAKAGTNMVEFAEGMEAALQTVPKAERTFASLNYLKDASKALVKVVGTGLTKSDRALTAAFGTFGEASIEALNNSNQFKDARIADFERVNGYKPTGDDLAKIEEEAAHVGNWSMGLNMALLSATNYIQFPKILNMSGKAEKAIINSVETQPLKQVEGTVVSALAQKGFAKKLYQAKNIAGLFFNPVEGFEEGAQYTIQEGTQDFFKKQYNNQDASFKSSLGHAIHETLNSKEGLENILIGALSGAIQTSGFLSLGRTGSIKERGFTGYGGERAKATTEAINTLNSAPFKEQLRTAVDAFNRAGALQREREKALRQGDVLESKDLERDYQFNYLLPRIKYGKFDFVQEDIDNYKNLASTADGFAQLQQEGIANETDTKESFLQRLNNFEEHAKSVKKSYEYLNNKYGGNKDFTPEVIDRLAYNMSKIQNYDERITQLSSDLAKKQIPVQDILNEIHKGNPSEASVKAAITAIDELNDVDSVKEDLKQQLQDVVELGLRRTSFKDEYNSIIKNPKPFIETSPKVETEATTVKLKTKTGEKDYEIGTEYMLGKVVEYDANGKEVYRFPKLTILGENEDDTIKIKTSSGEIRDIKKSELEDYKLFKVSDVQGNSTTRYYAAHINDIFQYNFGKDFGGRKRGRLTYENGKLYFTYKDDKGNIQNKELNRSHFEAQGKFADPRIKIVGGLEKATTEQKAAREAFLSPEEKQKEKDAQTLAEKNDARLQLMKELHEQTQNRLDSTKKLIADKTEQLEKINKELDELKAKSEKTALPRTKKEKALESKYPEMSGSFVRFSKILKTVPQAISKLVNAKEDVEYEINALKAQQEELEFNLSYMEDFSQNINEMPENSTQFLKDLAENVEWTKELIKETASNLSGLSKIYSKIEEGIKDLTSFLKSLFTKFDRDYPSYLKDGFDRMIAGGGILSEIKQVKEYIADYTLLQDTQKEISLDTDRLAEIEKQMKELYNDMVQLGKELSAKQAILDKFQVVANQYKEKEAEKNRLQTDTDLRAKFFKTTQALKKSDNEVNTEDTKEDTNELKKIDISVIAQATTEPMYDGTSEHDNAHRRHQEFLLNISTKPELRKLYEDGLIKILPVTAKTEEALGLKGIINSQYKDTSIRYVYVIDASNGILSYVDKDGNAVPMTKNTDLNTIIFTNARETDLSYSDKNGVRQPSYTNKLELSKDELQQVEEKWKDFRNILLNANITPENALDNTYEFSISRGLPVIKNTSTRNSLKDIGIIKDEDLAYPLITIPRYQGEGKDKTIEVPIHGTSLKSRMPLGKPLFNYKGNMFFLNNRNFTEAEAKSIANLLVEASKQIVQTGEINPKLQNYLSSVIRFSPVPARNTIHFDDNFNLFIGDKGNSIPILDLEAGKLAVLLQNEIYHHINMNMLDEFRKNPGNSPYTELQYKDGKIVEVNHPSYQHYLLTGKEPVLATNIAIPQDGKPALEQKYAILDFDNVDVLDIISKRKAEPAPEKTDVLSAANAALANLGKKQDPLEAANAALKDLGKKTEASKEGGLDLDVLNDALKNLGGKKKNLGGKKKNLGGKKKKFGGGNFTEPQTRLVGNAFKFLGNKEKELEEIKKMLPDVHIKFIKSLYETTGGLKAWGYALPKLITLYEGAPFGVAYHEAFEQVFNWLLTPKEQLELYKEFVQREGTFKTFNGEYKTFKSANFNEAKEQLADEFAEFKATGKIPYPKKNTSNFFKRLWEFIKSIFSNRQTIEGVFAKLAQGGFADSVTQVFDNNQKQFKRATVGVPEALFQDTINGFTAELFMKKWTEDASLISQLEDNNLEEVKPLFDQLYAGLERFYTEQGDNTLDAYYSKLVSDNPEMEDRYIEEYEQVQSLWNNVKSQWGNYMTDLRTFLKTFDVAFTQDENGDIQFSSELQEEYEKLGGADGYTSEARMFVNAKNSASKAVKLLFATVADSQYVKQITKDELQRVTEKYIGTIGTNRAENQMKLPNLAPYAKLFNYTLHNSANTNGIKNIYNNLRATAAKYNIGINANLTRLLNRLGYNGSFAGMSKESIKLVLKLENAISKTKPLFFKQYVHPKEGVVNQISNISSRAEQISEEWINLIKSSKGVISEGNKLKFNSTILNDNNFVFLSNLGIPFTKSDYDVLPAADKEKFNSELSFIKADVKGFTTKFIPISGELGFRSRLNTLAEIYTNNIEGDATESQHSNLDGEPYPNFILPNYVTFVLNDANSAKTKEEFLQLNPQFKDLYMGSSHLLNNVLFKNGERTSVKIETAIAEGIYDSKGNKIPHHKMSYSSRLLNEINNNLNGIYTALIPADAKTPWGLNIGNQLPKSFFTDKEKATSEYIDIMWNAMLNEVELAKDYDNRKHILSLNKKSEGREVGKSLRFFKGILSPELVKRINEKLIDNKESLSQEQITNFKTKFAEDLTKFIDKRAERTITNLKSYRLIELDRISGNYEPYGIDSRFMKSIKAGKRIKEETLRDIFFYREANYILNNIELHKLLFNDPAQYKDEVKRIKSFLSGREYAHSDKQSDLNSALDEKYNVSGSYKLSPTDWGYKAHTDEINTVTINTVKLPAEGDYIYDNYKNNDVADAQSWVLDNTYREMMIKSGGRFSSKQEKLHEWLMAYARVKGFEKGKIKEANYPKALQEADNKILKKKIPNAHLPIIKPIISGVSFENGIAKQFLYKTSSAPLHLYFVEGTPMEDIYWDAVENNVHQISMDSAHKVGQTSDNTVNWGDKFTKQSITPVDYRYFGIQVETGGLKDQQTQGSQLTKLATSGLIANGKPINDEAAKLIQRHKDILINLTLERSKYLLSKLDIKEGQFGFTIADKRKVAKFILDEITRRELPENIGIGIETNEENQFNAPLESNVNYKKIKEILFSTIENNILKPKVNGGPKILLSSLGYDVQTDRKYKFYQDKDGQYVCQIAIPFPFDLSILERIEKSQGLKFESQKEGFKHILKYLNSTKDGQNLLRGIGFRIPTQGLNSADHFEIVEFLPPQMGDCVIFPAEITTKAGSDFDVDKMNIYLKNHYIDSNGYPKSIPFYGYNQDAERKVNDLTLSGLLAEKVKPSETALDNVEIEEDNSPYIKSLENEYFSVLGDILSLKENRELLLKPNDANQLKDISAKVSPEDEIEGDFTNFVNSEYMFKKRQLFLAMKSAVGIAAVSNTNLALNQFTNLVIGPKRFYTDGGLVGNADHVFRNFKIRFPHNAEEGNKINLSHLKNVSGDFISDLGSQIIDGTVDVAKSEWLPKMLGDADNLNILLFMYKSGVNPYSAALFLHQPGIQEFVKRNDISKNTSLFNPKVKKEFPGNIRNKMIKDAGIKLKKQLLAFFDSKPERYTNKEMESFLGKSYEELNKTEKELQLQMMDDFFMIKQLAGDLFTIVNGYNWDTTRFQNPELATQKKLDLQQALELPNVSGQKDLLTKTHLGEIVKSVSNMSTGLSTLFSTQKGEVKRVLNQFALNLRSNFFKRDDRERFSQMGELSLIDFVINTQGKINGIPIEKLSKDEFFGVSISDWVNELKKKLPNNPILQNIEAVIDKREGYNSYLKLVEKDFDAFTSNLWTASLRELRDSGEIIELNGKTKTVGNLFQHIMISQFLQNGMSKGRNSFLHLIPNEEFSKIVSPILSNINADIDFWLREGLFFRNNYNNNDLITEAPKEYYERDADGVIETGYETPMLTDSKVTQQLEEKGLNSEIILLPEFGNGTKQFIKVTEYQYDDKGTVVDKRVKLYKRFQKNETEYYTIPNGYSSGVLFRAVNKLGNDNLKEYYSSSVKSILHENNAFNEVSDKELYTILVTNNYKVKEKKSTELLLSDEYDLSLDENETPKSVNLKPGKC